MGQLTLTPGCAVVPRNECLRFALTLPSDKHAGIARAAPRASSESPHRRACQRPSTAGLPARRRCQLGRVAPTGRHRLDSAPRSSVGISIVALEDWLEVSHARLVNPILVSGSAKILRTLDFANIRVLVRERLVAPRIHAILVPPHRRPKPLAERRHPAPLRSAVSLGAIVCSYRHGLLSGLIVARRISAHAFGRPLFGQEWLPKVLALDALAAPDALEKLAMCNLEYPKQNGSSSNSTSRPFSSEKRSASESRCACVKLPPSTKVIPTGHRPSHSQAATLGSPSAASVTSAAGGCGGVRVEAPTLGGANAGSRSPTQPLVQSASVTTAERKQAAGTGQLTPLLRCMQTHALRLDHSRARRLLIDHG